MNAFREFAREIVAIFMVGLASSVCAQSAVQPASARAIEINQDICGLSSATTKKLKRKADEGELTALRRIREYYEACSTKSELYMRYARLAARYGDALDAYEYASSIAQWRGIKQALPLFERAAQAGSLNAANWLGDAYLSGQYELPIAPATAAYWYEIGAKQGNVYAIDGLIDSLMILSSHKRGRRVEELAWIEVLEAMAPDYSLFPPDEYRNLVESKSRLKPQLLKALNSQELRRVGILKEDFLTDIESKRKTCWSSGGARLRP